MYAAGLSARATSGDSGNIVKAKASNILAANEADTSRRRKTGGAIDFEDAALVERTRSGDMQAYGLLVAKYQDRIFNTAYRMVGRREDAEELAQEAFLKALEKISQFRSQSRFYTWLFRIAVNLIISHRRHSGRIRFQSLAADELGLTQAAGLKARKSGQSPQAAAIKAETRLRIARALEELDDEMRLVIVLRDMEEMDYSQIADVLSVPTGTVKSRIHRARMLLRDKLADLMK